MDSLREKKDYGSDIDDEERRLDTPITPTAEINASVPIEEQPLPNGQSKEAEADDFELTTPRPSNLSTPVASSSPPLLDKHLRQGSMATVRLQRRAMLAEKLRDIFELDDIEEVRAGQSLYLAESCPHGISRNALLASAFDS